MFFRALYQPGVLHVPGVLAAAVVAGGRNRTMRADGACERKTRRLAYDIRRIVSDRMERSVNCGAVGVAEARVRTGHRRFVEQAGYRRVHAFDFAHVGSELRVVCGAALAGGAGGGSAAGGSVAVLRAARIPPALLCNLGFRDGTGSISGGGAYCFGTIWPVFFLEAVGAENRSRGAAGRQSDDLRRPGLRIIFVVLSAAAY